jgi:hypothetical protein
VIGSQCSLFLTAAVIAAPGLGFAFAPDSLLIAALRAYKG